MSEINYDNLFKKPKPFIFEPIPDCPKCEDKGYIKTDCYTCHGSGEGMCDGLWCKVCHGSGTVRVPCSCRRGYSIDVD